METNVNNDLDLTKIKKFFIEKLESSGWSKVLKGFINSSDFDNIIIELKKMSDEGRKFTPSLRNILKAFEACKYDDLKVIVIGQDPYPNGVATGIAFDCGESQRIQPSLKYIFDEINRTVYDGSEVCKDGNLLRWAEQGVLLLNYSLTTQMFKIGTHLELWSKFNSYLFDYLNIYKNDIVYVFMGKVSQKLSDLICNETCVKFHVLHPSSASYRGWKWNSNNVFNEINRVLEEKHITNIIWG